MPDNTLPAYEPTPEEIEALCAPMRARKRAQGETGSSRAQTGRLRVQKGRFDAAPHIRVIKDLRQRDFQDHDDYF